MQPHIIPEAISASLFGGIWEVSERIGLGVGAWERKGKTNDQNARGMSSYVWSCFPTILKLLTERRILVRQALF